MCGGASLLTPNCRVSSQGSIDARTAPVPMRKLCIAKPVVRCSEGRLSPTKARNGSIEMLMDASMIHSIPAATQSVGELGISQQRERREDGPGQEIGPPPPQPVPQVRSLR